METKLRSNIAPLVAPGESAVSRNMLQESWEESVLKTMLQIELDGGKENMKRGLNTGKIRTDALS